MIPRPPPELLTLVVLLAVSVLGYRWLGNSPWLLLIVLPLTAVAISLGARHGRARGAAARRRADEEER